MADEETTVQTIEEQAERQATEAREDGMALLATAESFVITTPDEYTESGGLVREIVAKRKAVEATRKGITEPMDAAKRRVMELFRPGLDMLGKAEDRLKAAMVRFQRAEDQKQREDQARLDDIARKERERLAVRAVKEEDKGNTEKADVLYETALRVTAPEVAPTTRAAGVHMRTTWSAEVTDLAALVAAIAAGTVPLECVEPCMPILNAHARAWKDKLAFPGVRAVGTQGMAARA